nr:uncharacterized protein LOC109158743 [Ipomoea batatas]
MLSNQTENQKNARASAEESDLLRRSTKKSKRGAREGSDEPVQMEEDGQAPSEPASGKNNDGTFGPPTQPARSPAISFRRALTGLKDKEEAPPEEGGAPPIPEDTAAKERRGPTWKASVDGAGNQGVNRPLGDKYGSWMIAQRKNRNYQNNGDYRRNPGRQTGG